VRTILSLLGVIAIILVLGYVFRKAVRGSGGLMGQLGAGGRAPSGVLSVLGRYPVARGTTLVLLKVDRRVLLLCQTQGKGMTAGSSMSTLCELTDPEDVASILLKTRDEDETSIAKRFESMLSKEDHEAEMVLEDAERGGAGSGSSVHTEATSGRRLHEEHQSLSQRQGYARVASPSVSRVAGAAGVVGAKVKPRAKDVEPGAYAAELRARVGELRAHSGKNGADVEAVGANTQSGATPTPEQNRAASSGVRNGGGARTPAMGGMLRGVVA